MRRDQNQESYEVSSPSKSGRPTIAVRDSRRAHLVDFTLGQKLREQRHDQNGFDTIRLIAATCVLLSHSYPIATGSNDQEPLTVLTKGQATLGGLSVGVFFVISGLLIAKSFEVSTSTSSFARKRALRIMPALIVLCLVLVLMLGPWATTLPMSAYLHGAWRFLGHALFVPVGFDLPGVFKNHPMDAVDGSLWSLKFEVVCYVGLGILMALRRGRTALLVSVWACSFIVSRLLNAGEGEAGVYFYLGTLASLFRFFGAGMTLYVFRDRIRLNRDVAWIALLLTLASVATPLFMEAAATAGTYALIVFGYGCPIWFRKVTARGDISYGTYLYAFPVQQIMFGLVGPSPWLISVAALPVTLFLAVFSWNLIEQPAMKLKKGLSLSEKGDAAFPTW